MGVTLPVQCESPKAGWQASLSLSIEKGPDRPVVRRRHVGPLTIQRPFFPEESVAHVYLLHPPGGVVGGDSINVQTSVEEGSAGLVTTPGATKFYRSKSTLTSTVSQTLVVRGGSLEWFPQENIFFNGCMSKLSTSVNVHGNAAVALWDIQCFGRPAGDEPFESGSVVNRLEVTIDDELAFFDRLVVNGQHPLSSRTILDAHPVTGTLLLNRMNSDACDAARQVLNGAPEFCVTLVDSLLIVRYVGCSTEKAKYIFTQIWNRLRPALNQRSPCVPRIWAT